MIGSRLGYYQGIVSKPMLKFTRAKWDIRLPYLFTFIPQRTRTTLGPRGFLALGGLSTEGARTSARGLIMLARTFGGFESEKTSGTRVNAN